MCFISGIAGQRVLKQGLSRAGDSWGTKEGLLSPAQAAPECYSWPCTDSSTDLAEKGSHIQLCLPAKATTASSDLLLFKAWTMNKSETLLLSLNTQPLGLAGTGQRNDPCHPPLSSPCISFIIFQLTVPMSCFCCAPGLHQVLPARGNTPALRQVPIFLEHFLVIFRAALFSVTPPLQVMGLAWVGGGQRRLGKVLEPGSIWDFCFEVPAWWLQLLAHARTALTAQPFHSM